MTEPIGPCWPHTGPLNNGGYGPHRKVYEALIGPVAPGLDLDHLCRVRHCCNPLHLEPVTRSENLRRGETITARNAAATHCPQGHAYEGRNIEWQKDGSRKCRECHRTRERNRSRLKVGIPLDRPGRLEALT